MYMREMGSVELLTREGEIEIAKRIEEGLKHMIQAISACPTTIAEILKLAERVQALVERGITPGLGTILVGDDGPSAKYVSMKHADCAEIGMTSVDRRLPNDATQADVEAAIDELNANPAVDAFIVQYPFPKGLDYGAALMRVDPAKDADGLHPVNLGRLVMGEDAPRRAATPGRHGSCPR